MAAFCLTFFLRRNQALKIGKPSFHSAQLPHWLNTYAELPSFS